MRSGWEVATVLDSIVQILVVRSYMNIKNNGLNERSFRADKAIITLLVII